MINWFNMPDEGLSNGGLFEIKELEVTENGTYETKGEMYNKVTVNVEGGGETWNTVFEGSVTTVEKENNADGVIEGVIGLTANTIKVTFNGVEYILNKGDDGGGNPWYGAVFNKGMIDFSEYPFAIYSDEGATLLITQTAGTYSLKIEESQSGEESDFSIANVHIVNSTSNSIETQPFPQIWEEDDIFVWSEGAYVEGNGDGYFNAVLYKGSVRFEIDTTSAVDVSGSATYEDGTLTVTGDCEVAIGGSPK